MSDFELYEYSEAVDPVLLAEAGCITTLPVRVSKSHHLAEEAWRKLVDDWAHHGATQDEIDSLTDAGALGSFIAAVISESLPDRLATMSRLYDWSLMLDDTCDQHDSEQAESTREAHVKFFDYGQPPHDPSASLRDNSDKNQFRAKLLLEFLETDRERACMYVKSWSDHVRTTVARDITEFDSLREYGIHRLTELGASAALTSLRYCMNLKLSAEEEEELAPLGDLGMITATLYNDYHSWGKEYLVYSSSPSTSRRPMNAVYLLMYKHGLTSGEAKSLLHEEIRHYEQAFVHLKSEYGKKKPFMSIDAKRYLMGIELMVSGTAWWSCTSRRYNKEHFHQPDSLRLVDHLRRGNIKEYKNTNGAGNYPNGTADHTNGTGKLTNGNGAMAHNNESTRNARAGAPQFLDLVFDTVKDRKEILKPYEYITSLPSKGVRSAFIDSVNLWYEVPYESLERIKKIGKLLHNSSLMLDDIEDNSRLRRGKPATQEVFGEGQTINSANYIYLLSLAEVAKLGSKQSIQIFLDELENLHIGQAMDLHWKFHMSCPSEAEYMKMVDNKTGGLFRLIVRLLQAESPVASDLDTTHLATLFGRYYQIRDDYKNLQCEEYSAQKGYCEDLDEGKFSLLLIHTLATGVRKDEATGILRRRDQTGLSKDMKELMLEIMEENGSFGYTEGVLQRLEYQLMEGMEKVGRERGAENYMLKVCLLLLAG